LLDQLECAGVRTLNEARQYRPHPEPAGGVEIRLTFDV
jgi:hypothetical protein